MKLKTEIVKSIFIAGFSVAAVLNAAPGGPAAPGTAPAPSVSDVPKEAPLSDAAVQPPAPPAPADPSAPPPASGDLGGPAQAVPMPQDSRPYPDDSQPGIDPNALPHDTELQQSERAHSMPPGTVDGVPPGSPGDGVGNVGGDPLGVAPNPHLEAHSGGYEQMPPVAPPAPQEAPRYDEFPEEEY